MEAGVPDAHPSHCDISNKFIKTSPLRFIQVRLHRPAPGAPMLKKLLLMVAALTLPILGPALRFPLP
jgi:hypothetical protein